MSFSGMVKEELAGRFSEARHCCIAELAAMLELSSRFEEGGEHPGSLVIHTENEAVSRKCFTLTKKTFNIEPEDYHGEEHHTGKAGEYSLRISDPLQQESILTAVKARPDHDGEAGLYICDDLVFQRDCCRRAFIRGAFLAAGSISDPNKAYHFEIVCQDAARAGQLRNLMESFGISARVVIRKKSHVVYVKDGTQIVDLLAVMGANVALMDLENIRIVKEMRNSVNRIVNCETANIGKTVSAAVSQAEDIRLVAEKIGLENLPDGLAQTAQLRIRFPEASLKELGIMSEPQVGKSGVNHRLRKLSRMAEALRRTEEEKL
ncbi:MAG: DNA-binding protein WhiA [Blautia sp.]|nr:DNA-binding protein WhiA [Blautia sp.]